MPRRATGAVLAGMARSALMPMNGRVRGAAMGLPPWSRTATTGDRAHRGCSPKCGISGGATLTIRPGVVQPQFARRLFVGLGISLTWLLARVDDCDGRCDMTRRVWVG